MPFLSEADPEVSAEGSIDPLGTYTIADSLAGRLVRGVRERHRHPRFLTATAVSLAVCDSFDSDQVASDGVSAPWQVFEWYMVEGLVRTVQDRKQLSGLPGSDKARAAIRDGVPLSANRYLKTPTVFGFHGVYRALARDVGIEQAGCMGDMAHRLLTTWAREQDLEGFVGSGGGKGASMRTQLRDAVEAGLKKGAVDRSSNWSGWRFFSDHLGIYESKPDELRLLREAILDETAGFRAEVMRFLVSDTGSEAWLTDDPDSQPSERRFHRELRKVASPSLIELLDAISSYERFCRLLQDAFDDCRFKMSSPQRPYRSAELADLDGVTRAAREVPEIFLEVSDRLSPFDQSKRFITSFQSLAERGSSHDWVERLFEHHLRIQRDKPPAGKAPWFDRLDNGSRLLRVKYLRDEATRHDQEYVQTYRTSSLWSFACDLGMVA